MAGLQSYILLLVTSLLAVCGLPHHQPLTSSSCGYDNCNLGNPAMINVHLVPHTHDDVGWLKTVDQYYYGSRSNTQRAGVQYILDTVVDQLLKDKNKKFIYVEIAFFWRWWNQQTDSMRHLVKGLVNNGQLEFILGGWCMNDEATTHYSAIIDQHTLGFKFLKTVFGDCAVPRAAWQIDPFGHSREQASLFAQMGFDSLFFGRLDYQDKNTRTKKRTLEMMWRGSDDLGTTGDLFTGVLWNGYSAPKGFCFDILCSDEPIMDDDRLNDYNVDEKVNAFIKTATEQAKAYNAGHIMMTMGMDFNYQDASSWYKNLDKLIQYVNAKARAYRSNHIMLTMGDDFNYQDAAMYFKNLDKLIQYVNAKQKTKSKVNVFYSTPSCYTYAKNKAALNWTTKGDDFFPYAESAHSFWTGYFTSRSSLKYYTRTVNGFFQAIKQMDVLAELGPLHDSDKKLDALRRAMGVLQHHDAVSGTERQDVAYDYAQRLARGVYEAQEVVQDVYNKLMPAANRSATVPTMFFCTLLNISKCAITENSKQFQITLYNSIGHQVSHWVRLPVTGSMYNVLGPDLKPVKTQVVPISPSTLAIPERNGSLAKNELVFQAVLPPLGFSTYFVTPSKSGDAVKPEVRVKGEHVMKNAYLSVRFGSDGMLKSVDNLDSGVSLGISQRLQYYNSYVGNNSLNYRSSGAYIFRPKSNTPVDISSVAKVSVVEGPLVQEVRQNLGPWASQVFRLYKGERYAEVEWTVGPIPIPDNKTGKEVISFYESGIYNPHGVFYTDSNGRQILKRQVNHRSTWQLNQTEEVAGNYYPINSIVYLRSTINNAQFMVLTDRAQGAGCNFRQPGTGTMEIMIQRRVLHDDALGVNQALNETGSDGRGIIVRGKHYLLVEKVETAARHHRDLALRIFKRPLTAFSNSTLTAADWVKNFKASWNGLTRALPANVNLLTLEHLHGRNILLRLEHMYQKNEDSQLSQPATVSLKGLFAPIQVANVTELTLGANQQLKDMQRLQWTYPTSSAKLQYHNLELNDELDIKLTPMQIRTFEVTLQH